MANIDMPPEGLARRLFMLTLLGVAAYITAVAILMSSPDDPRAAEASGAPEGAVAQRAP
jgi:hypothetical protein